MKEIILKRYYHNDCTLGKMKFTIKPKSNSRIKEERTITIYTLELPYRDNQKNISCIPEGEYILRPYKSGTLGKCFKVYSLDKNDKDNIPITGDTLYKLKEVPNGTGILIHRGCELKDTRGCIVDLLPKKLHSTIIFLQNSKIYFKILQTFNSFNNGNI